VSGYISYDVNEKRKWFEADEKNLIANKGKNLAFAGIEY